MGRSRMSLVAFRWLSSIIGVLLLIRGVSGAHNETVDDPSLAIIYTGAWNKSTTQPDRIDGTTHYTKVQGSFATFTFDGASAVYLVGYGVPAANINDSTVIDVELDGNINRVDQHRDQRGQVLMWGSGPIDSRISHTVVVRKTSVDNGGYDVNVDAFILTVPDAGDTAPNTTPSINGVASATNPAQTQTSTFTMTPLVSNTLPGPNSGLPAPSVIWMPSDGLASTAQSSGLPNPVLSNSSPNGMSTAAIAGATVGTVLLLSFIALFFYLLGKRRRGTKITTEKPKPGSAAAVPYNGLGSGTSSTLPITFAAREGKGGRSTRIRQVNASDERLQGGGPESEFSDATSEPTWLTGPPAYELLGSPRPIHGVSLPHVQGK